MATANMKDVKRRIKSVESTMQITKAMELVASSKMRKAKERAEAVSPFFNTLYETMCAISADREFSSMFLNKSISRGVLMVVIAGDRGLAGGFNHNVLKKANQRAEELVSENREVFVIAIGKKAVEYFAKRPYTVICGYSQIAESLNIYETGEIANEIISRFKHNEFGRVELFYTTLVSALVQNAETMTLLPLEAFHATKQTGLVQELTTYEPSAQAVFDGLIPQYVSGILYGAIIDSYAAEQAARRSAMESASDNAGEMIDNLSLLYNRARQAMITQELTEIVSGSMFHK